MSELQPAMPPPEQHPETPPPEPSGNGSGGALAWVVAVVILLGVIGGWFYLRQHRAAPAKVAQTPPPTAVATPSPPPVVFELPPTPTSDAQVMSWAARLGSPRLASLLKGTDWIRRITAAIDQLSEGKSPHAVLPFLAPKLPFTVDGRGGQKVISAKSTARYDGFAQVVDSVNVAEAAEAWHALHPLLAAAWKEIAPPSRTLDQGLSEALSPLIDLKLPTGPVALVPKGAVWAFADPKLEALTPARKQLLRMGRTNAARIQAKLAAFLRAVEVPVTPSP